MFIKVERWNVWKSEKFFWSDKEVLTLDEKSLYIHIYVIFTYIILFLNFDEKVINETEPLAGHDSEFGGIWYPTFVYSINQMFLTANSYTTSANLDSTTLTIDISETSYYIKNVQSPIAKQAEIIFRTLLFTILCLELSALVYLIIKLLILPLYKKVAHYFGPNNVVEVFSHPNHH